MGLLWMSVVEVNGLLGFRGVEVNGGVWMKGCCGERALHNKPVRHKKRARLNERARRTATQS